VRIVHFSFRDGQPREFPGRPSPLPLVLEIHVEVNNPSSFDFSPLGQLQLGIAPSSGACDLRGVDSGSSHLWP